MTISRRIVLAAVAFAFVVGACDVFTPEQLQYTVEVVNVKPPDFFHATPDMTVVTDDVRDHWSFAHCDNDCVVQVIGYVGGHYTVYVRVNSQAEVDAWKSDRDYYEAALARANNPADALEFIDHLHELSAKIKAAADRHDYVDQCTGTFPKSRLAIVQVAMVSETEAKLRCNADGGDG
jgi:hypothetical protein